MKIDQRLQWLLGLAAPKRELIIGALLGIFFAYITVVAIWKIRQEGDEETDPLKTRFGQTALAGLAGSVFTELISRLISTEPSTTPDVLMYYIMFFVVAFFVFLLWFASSNARLEGDRAEFMFGKGPVENIVRRDTFLNLIRGRNQMRSQAIVDAVAAYHGMIEDFSERLCAVIKEMIRMSARKPDLDVRVSISVTTHSKPEGDNEEVGSIVGLRYVAKDPRSLDKEFPKTSVAWFAVMVGEPRWYLKGWKDADDKFLLDVQNPADANVYQKALTDDFKPKILFKDFWMEREQDYDAFLIIPVPLRKRYMAQPARRGAIHISFTDVESFKSVFGNEIVGRAGFDKATLRAFESQDLVKTLEAMSYALVPLLRKYDRAKAQYAQRNASSTRARRPGAA